MNDQKESTGDMDRHWLDALIRSSEKRGESEAGLPTEEVVRGYLVGDASEEEIKSVKQALLHSAAFRKTLIERAKEMAAFVEAAETTEFKNMVVPQAPLEIRNLFAEVNDPAHESDSPKALGHTAGRQDAQSGNMFASLKSALRDWFTFSRVVPALGAAVVLLVSFQIFFGKPSLVLVSETLDKALLVSSALRQSTNGEVIEKAYNTAEDAALAAFRNLLEFDDNYNIQFRSMTKPKPIADQGRTMLLQFKTDDGQLLKEFPATFRDLNHASIHDIDAWILSLPSRELRMVKMSSDTIEVSWERLFGSMGCVAFTYGRGDEYMYFSEDTFSLK